MAEQRLMSVRADVVKEVLVPQLVASIEERVGGAPIPELTASLLEAGLEEPSSSPVAAQLARDGYFMRVIEAELFEPARRRSEPIAESLDELREASGDDMAAAAELSRELARREPLDKPDLGDERAASWKVPGPGGHVRHYVARQLIAQRTAGMNEAGDPRALKRHVMYGFFLRCCEEALEAPEA
jgi:hypothetical protein